MNWHDYRFSDREIIRAFCDESVATFDFLLAHGVQFPTKSPSGADGGPQNVKRSQTVVWTGEVNAYSPTGGNGTALMRPLEASAKKLGVQILLRHSMTGLVREEQFSGRVLGITATARRQDAEHPGETRRDPKHRRSHQQREFPQNFRSAPHRGISSGRRAVFAAIGRRRNCRHAGRRIALGSGVPNGRDASAFAHFRETLCDRQPVRLPAGRWQEK